MLLGFTAFVKEDDYNMFWKYLQRRFGIPENMTVLDLLPESQDNSVIRSKPIVFPPQNTDDCSSESDSATVLQKTKQTSPFLGDAN